MSRKLACVLVSTALVFSSVGSNAWAENTAAPTVKSEPAKTQDVSMNLPPLAPGGAAGIQEAQGLDPATRNLLIVVGAAAAIMIIVSMSYGDNESPIGTH